MMTRKLFYRCILFVFLVLLPVNLLYAQKSKQKALHELINKTAVKIYSNPDEVIQIGNTIIKKSDINADIKIQTYILLSDAYSSKRDYQKSLEYALKAYQLIPKTNNKLIIISTLNKLGVQYHQLQIYEKSMQYLEQAEQMIKAYPYQDSIHRILGVNYLVKGFIYKEKSADDLAIDFFDKATSEFLKVKSTAVYNLLSIVVYNKGNSYISLAKDDLALQSFDDAFNYAKEIDAKSLEAFALKGKGNVYTYQNKPDLAIQMLKEARFYASGVNDLILNREIYRGLSENYLAVGNLADYKHNNTQYLNVKSEIDSNERKSISDSLDEKTKELKSNFENRVQWFYMLYAVLLLILISLIFILQLLSKKRGKTIEAKKAAIQLLLHQNKK
jgi:tetratricopeptide (TPR) repeat protein